MDFSLTFNTRNKYKTKYVINQLNTMTKSNLNRNCTSFVSCFITYKFQPNIVNYSNVGLLIKWWQLYETINLVSIWDKNDFSRTFQEQQPKYGVFQEQFQNQKNSRTIQGIQERVATLLNYPRATSSDTATKLEDVLDDKPESLIV